jgi:hypothetical protein
MPEDAITDGCHAPQSEERLLANAEIQVPFLQRPKRKNKETT